MDGVPADRVACAARIQNCHSSAAIEGDDVAVGRAARGGTANLIVVRAGGEENAPKQIAEGAGSQFDPTIAEAFLKLPVRGS